MTLELAVREAASILAPAVKDADNKASRDIFGTAIVSASGAKVMLDGAASPVGCSFSVNCLDGDRVVCHIVNHRVVVFSNITNPDLSTAEVISHVKDHPNTGVIQNVVVSDSTLQDIDLHGFMATDGTIENTKISGGSIDGATLTNIPYAAIDELDAHSADIADARIGQATITQAQVENLVADKAEINGKLTAAEGNISQLQANTADIGTIRANAAKVQNLTANEISAATGYISDLTSGNVTAQNIIADKAKLAQLDVSQISADHATIAALDSNYAHISNGVIDNATIGYADVNGLSANYAQANMANVNNAWIANGTIKDGAISSAMINDVSANKLTAGTINGSVINVTNLNADNITTGTINGQRIGAGSLSLDKLSDDVYTESEVDAMLDTMQAEIDGAIETWTGTAVPTLNNAPASGWTTAADRDKHVGDVYFDTTSGYNYRFTKSGTGSSATYSWLQIKDTDITNALQRIQTAEGQITQFDSDISTLKTDTGTLKTKTQSLETSLGNKVDTSTFNDLSSTVDENSASIMSMSTVLTNNGLTSSTNITNTVNTVSQTASGNSSKISQLTTTLGTNADGTTKTGDIVHRTSAIEQDVSGFKQTVAETYATKTEAKQTDSDFGKREIATEDAAELPLLSLTAYGECEQDGTPMPDTPVPIKAVRGRNLIYGTQFRVGRVENATTMSPSVEDDIYKMVISDGNTANWNSSWWSVQPDTWALVKDTLSEGDPFTVSFLMRAVGSTAKPTIYLKPGMGYYVMQGTLSEEWSILSYSGTWKDANSNLNPHLGWASVNTASTYYIKAWQIECGSHAHHITPRGSIAAITTGKNIFNGQLRQGYISVSAGTQGEFGTSNSYASTLMFPVSGGNTYTVTAKLKDYGIKYCNMHLYDYAGKWLRQIQKSPASGSGAIEEHYDIPSDVACAVITMQSNAESKATPISQLDWMQVELGTTSTEYEPYRESVSYIDLQGHELASLPDGTRDELDIDAAGVKTIGQRVGVTSINDLTWAAYSHNDNRFVWNTVNQITIEMTSAAVTAPFMSDGFVAVSNNTTWAPGHISWSLYAKKKIMLITDPAINTQEALKQAYGDMLLYYPLATPQTIDLGYIDPPITFDDGSVRVIAEIQPVIDASWWTKSGYEAGKAFVEGNTSADLSALEQRVTTAETSITQQAGQIALKASQSSVDTLAGRVTTAESAITQQAGQIEAKVSKDGVIAAINLSTEQSGGSAAKISADKVEINGTAIFSAISSDVDDAITNKGYATTTQAQGYANTAESNAKAAIPTDISDLNNDTGFITSADVPKKVSDLTNDSGFQNATQVSSTVSNAVKDKADKSEIPTTVAELTDSGDYAKSDDIPTKVSELANDSSFATTGEVATAQAAATNAANQATDQKLTSYSTTSQMNSAIGNAVDTASDAITSRGEQLVTNGNAFMGDNTNFSKWVYDGAKANVSGGSFTNSIQYSATLQSDEFIPVDGNSIYEFSFDAMSENGDARLYGVFYCYDIDGNSIVAANILYVDGSTTTLAQDLKAGDTYVYLTDVSGFDPAGKDVNGAYSRSFIFWDYVNSKGYAWPIETYSRHLLYYDKWASHSSIDYTNNRILLKAAYSGTTVPAGTPVSQGNSGSAYEYPAAVNALIPSDWQHYSGYIRPKGVTVPSGANGTLRPGTAKAKVGFLWNYGGSASKPQSQIWVTNISLMKKRVTDAELAAVKTTADAAAPKSTAVKRTQRIYYRKSASGAPAAPGTASSAWVTNGNADSGWTKYNAWSTRIPPIAESKAEGATKYLYLYTCEQREMGDGTLAYTTVLLDDSTTVIDGGNIITGSVAANKLEVYDATIQKIRADAIDTASITIGQSQVTNLTSALAGKASTADVANAAKRTYVSIRATAIDYAADTATLEATLYIDGAATTTGVTYAWLVDGTAISGATARTYSVPASSGLSHAYSCKATW